jgi:hypothetical protein
LRSNDFGVIVEPTFRDSTRAKVITRGAAQANQIMADFKGSKPARKAKGGAVTCGCGGPISK